MTISYPKGASGIIVLLKTPPKYTKLIKNKIKTHTINGSSIMMAKPTRTFELHYQMI